MDYLKCAQCGKRYSLYDKSKAHLISNQGPGSPILLVCGHTFCQKCMVHCSTDSAITCPTCKMKSVCGVDNMKLRGLFPNFCILGMLTLHHDDFRLQELEDALQRVKKDDIKHNNQAQKCSECVKVSTMLNCLQCGVGFCSECFEVTHSSSRVLRRHQAIPFDSQKSDLTSLGCPKHHLLMEHYCSKDQMPVCKDCISTDHSEHEVSSILILCNVLNACKFSAKAWLRWFILYMTVEKVSRYM